MKRRVFQFWLYSYLIVLLIPIIITLIVLLQSQMMLEKEVRRANDTLLGQIEQSLDNQLFDIKKMGTQLSVEPKLISYLNMKHDSTDARLLSIDLIPSLRAYSTANGTIADAYIYLKQSDTALTTSTHAAADLIYEWYLAGSGKTLEEWKALYADFYAGDFIHIYDANKGVAPEPDNSIVYMQSLPLQDMKRAAATLVVIINKERLKQAIEKVDLADQGQLFIVDGQGNVIVSTGSHQQGAVQTLFRHLPNSKSGFIKQELDHQDTAISFTSSTVANWKYISVVPTDVYLLQVSQLKNLIVISLLLCVGLGGISAYWLTQKNYKPLRSMIDIISPKVKSHIVDKSNEYFILQQFMKESEERVDENNLRMRQQNNLLRNHFMARMLKGRIETGSVLSMAVDTFELKFETDEFAVILIQIEDYSQLFQKPLELDKKLEFVYSIITNILDEIVARKHVAYSTEVDGMIACLINIRGDAEEAKEELLVIAQEAHTFLRERFLIRSSFGISNIYKLWSSIPKCYEQAVEALEYKLLLGPNQIIAHDFIKNPKDEMYYPIDMERQLVNHIVTGDYDSAVDILQQVLIVNFSNGTLSIQLGKVLIFELVGTILKAVEHIQLSTKDIMIEKSDFVKQITQCDTFVEMETEIVGFLRMVCNYMQRQKKSHNSDLKVRILEEIESGLMDTDLSLTSISLALGVNPTYLSRFFKEQTGENLIDYVNKNRIEKVKSLLRQTDATINEISEKSGFASSQSLIRVFKKYEGITPGQFRQNL